MTQVYHLLHVLGVRFFAAGVTKVPACPAALPAPWPARLDNRTITFVPHFEYRGVCPRSPKLPAPSQIDLMAACSCLLRAAFRHSAAACLKHRPLVTAAINGWAAMHNPLHAQRSHLNDRAHLYGRVHGQAERAAGRGALRAGPGTPPGPAGTPAAYAVGYFVHTIWNLLQVGLAHTAPKTHTHTHTHTLSHTHSRTHTPAKVPAGTANGSPCAGRSDQRRPAARRRPTDCTIQDPPRVVQPELRGCRCSYSCNPDG